MNLNLITRFDHMFLDYACSENLLALSAERKIYLYRLDENAKFSLIDSFYFRNADGLIFTKDEEFLYFRDTGGKFYKYNIGLKKAEKITNKYGNLECFGNMYVSDNSDCLWCSGKRLFRYIGADCKIERLAEAEHNLKDIILTSDYNVYVTSEEVKNFYLMKISFDGNISEYRMPVSCPHKVLQHWFSAENEKIFLIKGNKLKKLDFYTDFERIPKKFETVCVHRDLKKAWSNSFCVSPKGDLISFSDYDEFIVFDILNGKPTVKIKKEKGTERHFGKVAFLSNDYLAVSEDNADFGGITCIYKITD